MRAGPPPPFPRGQDRHNSPQMMTTSDIPPPPLPSPSQEDFSHPPPWLLPRPSPGTRPPPPPPTGAGVPPPHLLSWSNVVPWPPPTAAASRDDRRCHNLVTLRQRRHPAREDEAGLHGTGAGDWWLSRVSRSQPQPYPPRAPWEHPHPRSHQHLQGRWRGGGERGADREPSGGASYTLSDGIAVGGAESDGGGGGFVLWHRDRDGLPGSDEDEEVDGAAVGFAVREARREQGEEKEEDEEDEDGEWEDEGEEQQQHFMLSEEWMERFARTEAARELRDRERRREARRRERPKVPAAVAAEERVAAVLAARRAAEQQQQQRQEEGAGDDKEEENEDEDQRRRLQTAADSDPAVSMYGVKGAVLIAHLEARLNAEYDALVDLKAPRHWPCEPLR